MKAPFKSLLLSLCFASSVVVSAQESVTISNANPVSEKIDVAESDRYKILFAAVKATEMEHMLDESGPFTIFAPSDAAFERFSNKKIQDLIDSEDKRELKSLLSYHIVAGHLSASKMLRAMCKGNGKASFTTVHGKKLVAHMDGVNIVLTDPIGNTARITVADVDQKNGLIHEIDSVIQPSQM